MLTSSTKEKSLLDFKSGGWVLLIAGLLTLLSVLQLLWPVLMGRKVAHLGDGVDVATYRFDMQTTLVPRAQIIAAGMAKDGLRAMVNPPLLTVAEVTALNGKGRGHFLVSRDLVMGVAIGSEARAYPLATLDLHEIVNDTVGGQAIAVTYNPLCASAVVFDRRVDGQTLEFGVSGLLYQSNLLLFDRQPATPGSPHESLWSQLQFRAVTGPAAARGAALALVPFAVTTWADWKQRHPETLVLGHDPALGEEYNHNRYGNYGASDEIKFPVAPLWDDAHLAKKTRVLAVQTRGQWTVYTLPKLIQEAGGTGHWSTGQGADALEFAVDPVTETARLLTAPPATAAIPCFLFAWHAQHPRDYRLVR